MLLWNVSYLRPGHRSSGRLKKGFESDAQFLVMLKAVQ
jgi:hypothetical protein